MKLINVDTVTIVIIIALCLTAIFGKLNLDTLLGTTIGGYYGFQTKKVEENKNV